MTRHRKSPEPEQRLTASLLIVLCVTTVNVLAVEKTFDPGEPQNPLPVITLSPGVDQLEAAIAMAAGGTVLLFPGRHVETGTVQVRYGVTVRGLSGAVLESATKMGTQPPYAIDPALHIFNTSRVTVDNVTIVPASNSLGGTAILVENAAKVRIVNNRIARHQFPVVIQFGSEITVFGNLIARNGLSVAATAATQGGPTEPEFSNTTERKIGDGGGPSGGSPLMTAGLVAVNTSATTIQQNVVTDYQVGLWLTARTGLVEGNLVQRNKSGIRLCSLPDGVFLISGGAYGSEAPAENWKVRNNTVIDNEVGYILAHGAWHNHIEVPHERALTNNARYDLEFGGSNDCRDHCGPASHDNMAHIMGWAKVIDCGRDNKIRGGDHIKCQ